MKTLTPASIALLRAAQVHGNASYATHPSTRNVLIERGLVEYKPLGEFNHPSLIITNAGRAFLESLT